MNNQNDLVTSRTIPEEVVKNIIGNYRIEHTIGTGTFGKVKLGVHLPTNEFVAIKILEKCKIKEKEDINRIMREMKFLKTLDHPNIIKVFEILENRKYFFIVMEYAESGELFHYIVKKKRLTEKEVNYFFFQIVNGLEYMHQNKVAHRDMKPENLLLTDEVHKIIKIIDFGLSNDSFEDQKLRTPCGSPCYAAPEMIRGKQYSGLKIDIWSTGIILFAMACGYLPFEDKVNENLFKKIIECKLEFPNYIAFIHKDLIKKILVPNPEDRISFEDIKKHPVYANGKNTFLRESKIHSELFFNESNEKKIKEYVIDAVSKELNVTRSQVESCVINKNYDVIISPFYQIFYKKVTKDKELLKTFLDTKPKSEESTPKGKMKNIDFDADDVNININYFNNVQCLNINVNFPNKTETSHTEEYNSEKIHLNKFKELITKKLNKKRPESVKINSERNRVNNSNLNKDVNEPNNTGKVINKMYEIKKLNLEFLSKANDEKISSPQKSPKEKAVSKEKHVRVKSLIACTDRKATQETKAKSLKTQIKEIITNYNKTNIRSDTKDNKQIKSPSLEGNLFSSRLKKKVGSTSQNPGLSNNHIMNISYRAEMNQTSQVIKKNLLIKDNKKINDARRVKNISLIDFSEKSLNNTQRFHSMFKNYFLSNNKDQKSKNPEEVKNTTAYQTQSGNMLKFQSLNSSPREINPEVLICNIETDTNTSKPSSPIRSIKISQVIRPNTSRQSKNAVNKTSNLIQNSTVIKTPVRTKQSSPFPKDIHLNLANKKIVKKESNKTNSLYASPVSPIKHKSYTQTILKKLLLEKETHPKQNK